MSVTVYKNDLPLEVKNKLLKERNIISMDTETNGLNPIENDLLIIQIRAGDSYYIIQFNKEYRPANLLSVLENENIKKIFHHAVFDVRFLMNHLVTNKVNNIICTKIAAKLLFGEEGKNSLKDLIEEFLNIKLDKGERLSDWSKENLSDKQIEYAINDVRYLKEIWEVMEEKLKKEDLLLLAEECFNFIPFISRVENMNIKNIFKY
ncbi:ribonuclease D [Thalassobacillus hwangdonensis]|uniref:Ribonuclease D n=1 Tax=Thalassobacillus hwangdonensis TaxID=546108 RepID=A0ABW3L5K0_9BACI